MGWGEATTCIGARRGPEDPSPHSSSPRFSPSRSRLRAPPSPPRISRQTGAHLRPTCYQATFSRVSLWKTCRRQGRAGAASLGGSCPIRRDHSDSEQRRDRLPRSPAGVSAPSSPPRTGNAPRRGVSPYLPCSARCHVSPARTPLRAAPCTPWSFPPSPSRARPVPKAARQARDFSGLRAALCLLWDAPRARARHARPRSSVVPRGRPRTRQPRRRLPGLQPAEGIAPSRRVLRPLPVGRRELHAIRTGGTPCTEARRATRREPGVRAGGVGTRATRQSIGGQPFTTAASGRGDQRWTVGRLSPVRGARSSSRSVSSVSITCFRSAPHA